jgi:putative hydroxymethylpyrimidine transport system substrate-binding protein
MTPMIRTTLLLAVLTVLFRPAAATEKLTLLLDWFINPDHAPLIVAQQRGYFKAAGLELTIIEPSNPNDPPRLVAAGRGDIAISYQPQLHIQVDKGLPLVRIGTLVATPLNSVVVLKDGPIRSLKDLKGRKVGYSVAGTEQALLGAMLERHGLTLKDVTLINVNFNLSAALLSRRVDAVVGAYRNFELNQLDIEKRPGRAFYPEEHGVPAYDELIAIAKADRIGDPRFPKFLRAWERGVVYLLNHPKESWKLFIRGREKKLDNELNRRAWRDTLPRFASRPAALDRRRYRAFAAFLRSRGLIKATPPVSRYAVELD